jgi:thiol-disulfide isomerase/thioredoxin
MKRKDHVFRLSGLIMAALVLLSACNGAEPESAGLPLTSAIDSGQNPDAAEQDTAQISNNLPADFPVVVYQGAGFQDGDQVQFSELVAKGRPVVLNFWAGLCPPCRLEMPDLQAVSEAYEDRILLLGVDVGPFTALGSHEDARRLLNELAITYPAGTTTDPGVMRQYEIRGMPSTYFILANGRLFQTWTGLLTQEKLTELVEQMLAAPVES